MGFKILPESIRTHFGSNPFGLGLVQRSGYGTPAATAETSTAECRGYETIITGDKPDISAVEC